MMSTSETLPEMFDRASARYDLLNSLLSLGRDGAWREAMSRALEPGEKILDVCCGSARSSVSVFRRSKVPVVGLDASHPMLERGVEHARRQGVTFLAVRGDALRLPFAEGAFDAVTVAWGLRNLTPEDRALAELTRVLRPGGWLHVLDSPSPEPGWSGALHHFYLRMVVPWMGRLSPDPEAYRYLSRSVLAFGTASEVNVRLERAGLICGPPRRLFFGAAALWRGQRPGAAVQSARKPPEVVQIAETAGRASA